MKLFDTVMNRLLRPTSLPLEGRGAIHPLSGIPDRIRLKRTRDSQFIVMHDWAPGSASVCSECQWQFNTVIR